MKKNEVKQKIVESLKENLDALTKAVPTKLPSMPMNPEPTNVKAKETVVTFDKSTSPFEVKYSERGFEINGTRLSFELIETALSKEVNIVLDKGKGVVLDSIKMNKILKYKDLHARM